jgi:hypothetical protein
MPCPLGTHVRFASNSEASSTQHFIVDPISQGLTPAFFTLKTRLESCTLIGS